MDVGYWRFYLSPPLYVQNPTTQPLECQKRSTPPFLQKSNPRESLLRTLASSIYRDAFLTFMKVLWEIHSWVCWALFYMYTIYFNNNIFTPLRKLWGTYVSALVNILYNKYEYWPLGHLTGNSTGSVLILFHFKHGSSDVILR